MKSGIFAKSPLNLSNTHSEWSQHCILKILFFLPNIQLVVAVVCRKAYFVNPLNWAFAVSIELYQYPVLVPCYHSSLTSYFKIKIRKYEQLSF